MDSSINDNISNILSATKNCLPKQYKYCKRLPIRKTNSSYTDSTISVQNIELPVKPSFLSELQNQKKPFNYQKLKPTCEQNLLPITKRYKNKLTCEKVNAKKLCVNVEQVPIIQTEKINVCRPRPKPLNQTKEKQLIAKTFCKKVKSGYILPPASIELLDKVEKVLKPIKTTGKRLSNRTVASQLNKKLPPQCKLSLFGDEKKKFVGKCTPKDAEIKLPHEKHKQFKFTLTEDPRQITCLKNPYFKNKTFDFIEEVKLADNVSTDKSIDNKSISICEEIDLENPFHLDYHGIDYKASYENDEQNFQNVIEYHIIKRYQDRRNTKVDVERQGKQDALKKKFDTPEFFDVDFKYVNKDKKTWVEQEENVNIEPESDDKLAKMYRTPDKLFNRTITEFEVNQRKGRYLNLYITRTELEKEREKNQCEINAINEANKTLNIGQDIFDNAMDQETVNNYDELKLLLPKDERKSTYPHNLKETKRLRHKMKKSKLIIHEKALVREQFYKDKGKNRIINDAKIELSDMSQTLSSISEQISDDEDTLQVGLINSKYNLRGYHYGLGTHIRGKFQKNELLGGNGKPVHGCMTRNEWFEKIHRFQKTEPFYRYNPAPLPFVQDPNDNNLNIFPQLPLQATPVETSPINDVIKQQIGQQYTRVLTKNIHIKKPKSLKVKKFNLTGYMYGVVDKFKLTNNDNQLNNNENTLIDYINNKIKLVKLYKTRKRRQRMHYLGIPFNKKIINEQHELCNYSSSSESADWVPPTDNIKENDSIDLIASTMNFGRSHEIVLEKGGQKELSQPQHLIPAPEYREPTVRPKYYNKFINIMEDPDKPYLFPPVHTKHIESNLSTVKAQYMEVLEARHHHEHIDPTQHKTLHTKYNPKIPICTNDIQIVENVKINENDNKKKGFVKAVPKRLELRDIDMSLPNFRDDYDFDAMKIEYQPNICNQDKKENTNKKIKKNKDIIDTGLYHTLLNPPQHFDGHNKFSELIDDMVKAIKYQQRSLADDKVDVIDKDEYLNQLNDELLSVKTCLSSLSSSICTNFTNDSGSFLMIQDKKIPMDYIRKSLVPFEELNHVHIKGEIQNKHTVSPYHVCPFAGQLQEQVKKAYEKFHTFKTRIQNDLRARLHVHSNELKNQLLGPENKKKYNPLFAIDLDELYIEELHNRPPVKVFRPKTSMQVVKIALKKKYVCWSIQQKIIECKAAQELELNYYNAIIDLQELIQQLFQKWEKEFYEASMEAMSIVKPYYETTYKMKKQLIENEQKNLSLNMEIIMIEDDLRRRIILQNFHYLIMKTSWRELNDWIHLNEDGELENYRESIQKRYVVNLRKRDRDDAWIIKDYFYNVYLPNKHPIEIVFPDTQSFIEGVESLKSKTFVCLLELHFAMWVWTTLEQKLNQFLNWSNEFLLKQTKFVKAKCSKKYFMEDRENYLIETTKHLMDEPLAKSISAYDMRLFMATCDVVYEKIVPASVRAAIKDDIEVLDKTELIWDTIDELFTEIDTLPRALFATTERSYRRRLKYDIRMSQAAIQIEKRIAVSMAEVKKNLAPPFVKPKREGKLPRMYLKKKPPPPPPPPKPLSEKSKYFFLAFNDENEPVPTAEELRDSIEVLSQVRDENIPFHFDHFLRLNDYIPNYNFKTEIEIQDGPEELFFKNKALVPEVLIKLQSWETNKQFQVELDIKKYSHMYENVKS